MIWRWIVLGWTWFLKLTIFPPPRPVVLPSIDPNAPCPSCGNRNGAIVAVKLPSNVMMVRHTCGTCKAIWHEKPVTNFRHIIHPPTAPTNDKAAK